MPYKHGTVQNGDSSSLLYYTIISINIIITVIIIIISMIIIIIVIIIIIILLFPQFRGYNYTAKVEIFGFMNCAILEMKQFCLGFFNLLL